MPYLSVNVIDSWQGVHVASANLARETGERGSFGDMIPCSPWQLVQTGDLASPLLINWP
jgi:hypothetical protein